MAGEQLKSSSITGLDAAIVSPPQQGMGSPSESRRVSDYALATTVGLASTSSTYRLIRVPTIAVLKTLTLVADELDSATSLLVDVGAYYSDSPNNDGTSPANSGALISANCFAAAVAVGHGAAAQGVRVNVLTAFTANELNMTLFNALGIEITPEGSSDNGDPGGYIDVVVAVHTAAGTAVSGNIYIEAEYCI